MAGLFDEIEGTGREAERLAVKRDRSQRGWLDDADAARHIAASAEAAWRFGDLPAQALGLANEAKYLRPGPGTLMDIENNSVGARLGASLTPEQVYARMAETGLSFDAARRQLIAELAVGWTQTPAAASYSRAVRIPDFTKMDALDVEMALPRRPAAFVPRSGMFADQLNWLTRPRW